MDYLYELTQVSFEYRTGDHLGNQKVSALQDVSCQVGPGDFVCLSGPSGSGKSTLLNLLGLIEPPQAGTIRFQNQDVSKLTNYEKNRLRKFELGFIFQSFNLFPVLSAQENVEYFLYRQGLSSTKRAEQTRHALEAVGLWEHRNKRPSQLSGGQKQRVGVARAIAKRPKVILADEPTASLDQATGLEVMRLFTQFNREMGTTFIVCSHDPMVMRQCQKHFYLRDGALSSSEARAS